MRMIEYKVIIFLMKNTIFDMNSFLFQFGKLLGESGHFFVCFRLVAPCSFIFK